MPESVRPLAAEWDLTALTTCQPRLRYAYEGVRAVGNLLAGIEEEVTVREVGDLSAGVNWTIVVPRVVAGSPADKPFALWVGVAGWIDDKQKVARFASCGVQVAFATDSVKAGVKPVPDPAQDPTDPPSTNLELTGEPGPVDLRVTVAEGKVYLAVRRSDRDAPWSPPKEIGGATDVGKAAWVEVVRVAAAGDDRAIVLGVPGFAVGGVDEKGNAAVDPPPLPGADAPLLLRKEDNDRYEFKLRPPATDLDTWTAWRSWDIKAPGDPVAVERQTVWAYHKYRTRPLPKDATREDGSIDDPTVDVLIVELVPLHWDESQSPNAIDRKVWTPKPVPDPDNPMWMVQRPAATFSVSTSKLNGPPTPDRLNVANADEFKIQLRERELWELRVFPAVRSSWFAASNTPGAQRFHTQFTDGPEYDDGGTKYRLFTPWRVTIEVATQAIVLPAIPKPSKEEEPKEAVLYRALIPRFDGRSATVTLEAAERRTFRYTGQMRLLRQVWRWRGRPVPSFPFDAAAPTMIDAFPTAQTDPETPDVPMLWDGAGFGDRSPIDLLEETKPVTALTKATRLFSEDLSRDARALYYRFTAQALSRYAGLYPPAAVQATIIDRDNAERPLTAWRRLLVPCRRQDRPDPPSVRFVVPLTQAEADLSSGTPGLLVVLNDGWFAVGGLAEVLDAEVAPGFDYWGTTDKTARTRPEFGPDPTLTRHGWTKGAFTGKDDPNVPDVPDESLALSTVGPIGHTFDTDADAPLFNASSFIVRPPQVPPVPGGDGTLAWYFARLRFRRTLLPEAFADYKPGRLKEDPPWTYSANPLLDAAKPWAVDVTLLVKPPMAGATVTLNRVVKKNGDETRIEGVVTLGWANGGDVTLQWTFRRQNAIQSTNGTAQAKIPMKATAKTARLDLRFLLQPLDHEPKKGAQAAGEKTPPLKPCNLTVQYRLARPTEAEKAAGAALARHGWQVLAAQTWLAPPDELWPDKVIVTGVEGAQALAVPAHVSSYSPPQWVQFLPEADRWRLSKDWDRPHAAQWGPGNKWHLVRQGTDGKWASAMNALKETWPGLEPTGHPENVEDVEVRAAQLVVLTERVSDYRGQLTQERYAGLFGVTGEWLSPAPRDPTAARLAAEPADRRFRLRVVEFQWVKRARSNDAWQPSWDGLFPADTTAAPADAQARVVRVSPPLDLEERGS